MAMRKNSEIAPLSEYVPYGLTVNVNPVMVVIDKEILEHYGQATDYEKTDHAGLTDIAKATTGTDPVTGNRPTA